MSDERAHGLELVLFLALSVGELEVDAALLRFGLHVGRERRTPVAFRTDLAEAKRQSRGGTGGGEQTEAERDGAKQMRLIHCFLLQECFWNETSPNDVLPRPLLFAMAPRLDGAPGLQEGPHPLPCLQKLEIGLSPRDESPETPDRNGTPPQKSRSNRLAEPYPTKPPS